MLALHTRIIFYQTAETAGALAGLVGVTSASLPEPRGTLETHAARVSLELTRGTILPEVKDVLGSHNYPSLLNCFL